MIFLAKTEKMQQKVINRPQNHKTGCRRPRRAVQNRTAGRRKTPQSIAKVPCKSAQNIAGRALHFAAKQDIIGLAHPPVCWNWQTRRTQNPLPARACGFDPHHRHKSQAPMAYPAMRAWDLSCRGEGSKRATAPQRRGESVQWTVRQPAGDPHRPAARRAFCYAGGGGASVTPRCARCCAASVSSPQRPSHRRCCCFAWRCRDKTLYPGPRPAAAQSIPPGGCGI